MSATPVKRDTMVVVEWTNHPRYEGTQHDVVARTIVDPPIASLRVGDRVRVKMGKSAGARLWTGVFKGRADELKSKANRSTKVKKLKKAKKATVETVSTALLTLTRV